jgi:hypothetical protein
MELLLMLQAAAPTAAPTVERDFTLIVLGILGIICAILGQSGAMFYWGGKLRESVTQLQEDKRDHERRIGVLEVDGSPLARLAAVSLDKDHDAMEALRTRLEDHIAALGTSLIRTDHLERRTTNVEERCADIHPPAVATQRMAAQP